MEFTLHYRGPLHGGNGRVKEKHAIRVDFHEQLRMLWSQVPLIVFSFLHDPAKAESLCIRRDALGFTFVPLVCESISAVAEIDVTMLRPGPPGRIVTLGGDIDNRLKTLFDAFRVPQHAGELPPGCIPAPDQAPFYCLMEDGIVHGIMRVMRKGSCWHCVEVLGMLILSRQPRFRRSAKSR